MRRSLALVPLFAALALAGCGGSSSSSSSSGKTTASNSCAKADLTLVNAGKLTVGTDNPAFPPWFGGPEKSPWKVSDPRSGQGFESAVTYAVAKKLGFTNPEVNWIVVPFNTSFAPGPKKFDFDINQISYTPARAKVVDFSDSYYNVIRPSSLSVARRLQARSRAPTCRSTSSARRSERRATSTSRSSSSRHSNRLSSTRMTQRWRR